jgi:NADH-quinone oxidoreductase subunit M
MVKRVYFGPMVNDEVKHLKDINAREFFMLSLLAAAVMVMGLYPKPFTDVMNASVNQLIQQASVSKLPL